MEVAADRKRVDGQLATRHVLLDEEGRAARRGQRDLHRLLHLASRADERQSALALTVRRLDDAGKADAPRGLGGLVRSRTDLVRGLRDARLGEAFALAQLRGREHGRLGRERVRQREPLCDACRDRDRPVDPGSDQSVDPLGARQPLDGGLVLGRNDRPAVGVAEAGCRGLPVDGDHVELTRPRGGQQAELRRSGA